MKSLSFSFGPLVLALTFSVAASANDGGMAYVDVQGVNPTTTTNLGKQITVESGSVIEFYGQDAEKFMRLLPATTSVVIGMVPKDQAELYSDMSRGVLIASKNYALNVGCTGIELDETGTKLQVKKAKQVTCRISIDKTQSPKDYAGDGFQLNTKDKTQRTCN